MLRLYRMGTRRKEAIRQLEDRCMKMDRTVHRMYLDSDCNLDPYMKCFYILEIQGHPRSVLSISNLEPGRAEISAFTDPEYRRRGLFLELWKEAASMLAHRGFERAYFVHEPVSEAGKQVLHRMGARYEKSEYLMEKVLNEGEEAKLPLITELPSIGKLPSAEKLSTGTDSSTTPAIEIARANPEDAEELSLLLSDCFSMDPESARERIAGEFAGEDSGESSREDSGEDAGDRAGAGVRYLLWKASREKAAAGMCVAGMEGESAFLFDICVREQDRRRGIGRALLLRALADLAACKVRSVRLQTGSKRKAAVRLYRSLGFAVTDQIDYYEMPIDPSEPFSLPRSVPRGHSGTSSDPS